MSNPEGKKVESTMFKGKMFEGKKVLLGVTGGIAAYKSIELVRRLNDAGIEVRVVMTKAATEFVTPMTFEAISGNPVHTEMFGPRIKSAIEHVELARWADLIVVAPATANIMAKLANGITDDLLSTVLLAMIDIDIAFAPAMNLGMWQNQATQENIKTLKERGYLTWGPADGFQACGEIGSGRMIEASEIAHHVFNYFHTKESESGSFNKKVVITAGPTLERLDPVRYITNKSSGKMGYAVAQSMSLVGAEVILVSGPTNLAPPYGVTKIDVESAEEMHKAVMEHIESADIFIGTAAVADYKPSTEQKNKIKKSNETLSIDLIKNPDILADVAALDSPPFTVGFAAETENVAEYAKGKLINKKLDMIAANLVGKHSEDGEELGFNSDMNQLTIFFNGGEIALELDSKEVLAEKLTEVIMERYNYVNK